MNFKIKTSEFFSRVEQLSKLTKRDKHDPAKGKIVIEIVDGCLRLDATNDYTSMALFAPVLESDSVSDCAVVDIKSLLNLLRKVKTEDVIVTSNEVVVVKSGRSRFKLKTFDLLEMPFLKLNEAGVSASLSSSALYRLFDRVWYASAADDELSRHYLKGVFLHTDAGKLVSVGLDGHRLARYAVACGAFNIPDGIVVPNEGVKHLIKFLDTEDHEVNVAVGGGKLMVSDDSGEVVIRLLENQFPEYQRLIPEVDTTVDMDTDLLRSALVQSAPVADKDQRVIMSVDGSSLLFEVSSEKGCSAHAIDFDAEDGVTIPKVSFNRKYMEEALKCLVVFDFKDGLSPIMLKGLVDKEYKAVVMPMSL